MIDGDTFTNLAILLNEPYGKPDPKFVRQLAQALRDQRRQGREEGMSKAADICDKERVRQINGDRFEKLNGQDTAFMLARSIREATSKAGTDV